MLEMLLGRQRLILRTAFAVLVGILFTACCPKGPTPPQPASPCRAGVAPSNAAEVDACLKGYSFDENYLVGDQQALSIISRGHGELCPGDSVRTCQYGPVAKIEPIVGVQNYSDKDLREGRFIARIRITAGTRDYPKYGLKPGSVTYWWVKTDATGTTGQSLFITIGPDRSYSTQPRTLTRVPYSQSRDYKKGETIQGIMRWIWDLEDETAKGQCGSATCH